MTQDDEQVLDTTVDTAEEEPPMMVTRRVSRPAARPTGMDDIAGEEPEKPKRPSIDDVEGIGGMVKTYWSGIPMWRCPKCNGTTFDEKQSRVHKCKRILYAGEEDSAAE